MATTSMTRRGVSPVVLASLATGGYLVLAALIVLSPFVLSPYAIQNDVYMGNLFIGPPLLVIGGILCVVSLLLIRARKWAVAWGAGVVLAVTGSGLLALLYAPFGGHYVSVGPPASWPPYLNEPMMVVTLALGLAVFGLGWAWGNRMGRQPRQRGVDATPAGM